MSALITKTAQLLPYAKPPRSAAGIATCYFHEPDTGHEATLGSLYVVIEAMGNRSQAQEVIDLVIGGIGNHFYNADRAGRSPADQFEEAVKSLNAELADFASRGNGGWVGKLNAVIAILSGGELHLTQAGTAEAYLYRRRQSLHISDRLGSKQPYRPSKTFGQIASGQLQTGDRLLLGTPALFHQFDRSELRASVVDSTPSSAVHKLTELAKQHEHSDRSAAVVIEVASPESLALQLKSDQPDTAVIGPPESILDAARSTSQPLIKHAKSGGRLSSRTLSAGREALVPRLRTLFGSAGRLSERTGRGFSRSGVTSKHLLIAALAVVGLGLWLGHSRAQSGAVNALVTRYDHALTNRRQAESHLVGGNQEAARTSLSAAQSELAELLNSPRVKALDAKLSKRKHGKDDPGSVSKLQAAVTELLDQTEGLTRIGAETLGVLKTSAGKPKFLERVAGNLVIITDKAGIQIYDTKSAKLSDSKTTGPEDQQVVATTATSDGVYLLTDKPSVWFYDLNSDSLDQQSLSFGDWPKGKAIATYDDNLYILAADDSQVYKHTKTLAGFSSRTPYLSRADTAGLSGSLSLGIDGLVYVGGRNGISRFLAGTLRETFKGLPAALKAPREVRSYNDGADILTLDSETGRLGLLKFDGIKLAFNKQYLVNDKPKPSSIIFEPASGSLYSVADNQLVKAAIKL